MTVTIGKKHLVAAIVLVAVAAAGFFIGRDTAPSSSSQPNTIHATVTTIAAPPEGTPYLSPGMAKETDAGACNGLKQDELQGASGRNSGAAIEIFAAETEAAARGQQPGTLPVVLASDAQGMLQILAQLGGPTNANMYPTVATGKDCDALGVTIDAQSTP